MKKMFYLSSLLIWLACKQSAPILPDFVKPTDQCSDSLKELKPLWQQPLLKDTSRCVGSTYIAFDDKIGVIVADKRNQRLATYNAKQGTFFWEHIISPDILGSKYLSSGIWSNKLILNCYQNQRIVDNQTGQLLSIATMPTGKGDYRMNLLANAVYQNSAPNQFHDSVSQLLRLKLETLTWDTVCALQRKEHFGYMGFIEAPALSLNQAQDSILYFKFRTILPNNPTSGRLFFYAYNMSQKRIEWRKDSLDYDGSVYPPLVEKGRVYVDGLNKIYCLDAYTGQEIWSREVSSHLVGGTGLFLYKDRLTTISLGGKFIVLDKNSGNWIYNYQDDSNGAYDLNTPSPAVVYNGVMYVMAGGSFYGLDLETGTILGKYRSPNRCKKGALFGYGGIAANAVSNCIYVDDEYFLMAIKAFK